MPTDAGPLTELIRSAAAGDTEAEGQLLQTLYAELRRMAARHLRGERRAHSLQPTALVNEAYVRLMRGAPQAWRDRLHFFASASTVMRRILVDHARRRGAGKRGDGIAPEPLADAIGAEPVDVVRVLAVDEALTLLAATEPRQARVVELRYFAGLTDEEIAALLGVSSRTIKREWVAAKAWLYTRLGG